MLVVVTSKPSRFTSTGGAVLPLGEAITTYRIDVLAFFVDVVNVGSANVCKTGGNPANALADSVSCDALSTATTFAKIALRLLLNWLSSAGVAPRVFKTVFKTLPNNKPAPVLSVA